MIYAWLHRLVAFLSFRWVEQLAVLAEAHPHHVAASDSLARLSQELREKVRPIRPTCKLLLMDAGERKVRTIVTIDAAKRRPRYTTSDGRVYEAVRQDLEGDWIYRLVQVEPK